MELIPCNNGYQEPEVLENHQQCAKIEAQKEREWAALPSELVEDVANLLLDNDVADLICFRLVCKPWKNTVKLDPSALDRRYHPRWWILLPRSNDRSTWCEFLNIVTRKTIKMDLELVGNHTVVAGSTAAPEGMLVLRDEASLIIRILNPLTGHVIDLPSVKTLRRGRRRGPVSRKFREEHKVTAAGFSGDTNVVIYFGEVNRMVVAKPGDARWTPVRGLRSPILTSITFQRRFYCIDHQNLLVLDMSGVFPRLVVAIAMNTRLYSVNLLDNSGKNLMVQCRRMPWDSRVFRYQNVILVYKVDLEEGTVTRVHDLAGQAVFAGDLGAVVLPSATLWPCVESNAVYFKFGRSQVFGVHHMGRPYPDYRDVVGTCGIPQNHY
uniref:Uncharacterized protein n=1 Tax=Avena sativa TaxID=4498 RepID=A0ACD5YBN3_AVESA